jgi:hypothetical protein
LIFKKTQHPTAIGIFLKLQKKITLKHIKDKLLQTKIKILKAVTGKNTLQTGKHHKNF